MILYGGKIGDVGKLIKRDTILYFMMIFQFQRLLGKNWASIEIQKACSKSLRFLETLNLI
jgi:hypothetical protein